MSIELRHIMARKRTVLFALVLWCLVLVLGVMYLFSQRNDVLPNAPVVKNAFMQAADNTAAKYQGLALRPNMLATVAVVFDPKNTLLAYTPSVQKGEENIKSAVEESTFDTPYAHYNYKLTSTQTGNTDNTYVTDSLELDVTTTVQGVETIVRYMDDGADGSLDEVYVGDSKVEDQAFFAAAQDQYTAELVVSRNYLLGLTTEK